MSSLNLLSVRLVKRMTCQLQRTMLTASYINKHHVPAYGFYKRTRNAKADKERIQKLYKKSGLKSLSGFIPHSIIYAVEDENDLKFVTEIVKEYIDQANETFLKNKSEPKSLLSNLFWMCYTLNDVEAAKSIGSLEKSINIFENERGHALNTYMTILYNNECFEDLVNICDTMISCSRSQVPIMLTASLYRIGTKAAYDKLLTYSNVRVMNQNRIKVITAHFALRHKDFGTCLDSLKFLRRNEEFADYDQFPPKLAPTNLFILYHLRKDGVESALNLCQKWIGNLSDESDYKMILFQDVYEELENAVKDKPELQESWTDLCEVLKSGVKATMKLDKLERYLFEPLDLAPNPKKAERKEKYESGLKERNLYRGAKLQKNTPDLSPELE